LEEAESKDRFTTLCHSVHRGIQSSQFAEVVDLAISVGFCGLAEEYPPPGNDLPDYAIRVETGLCDKTVQTWGASAPPEFETLADRLGAIAETVEWENVRDEL
jgi:hypothetical protein